MRDVAQISNEEPSRRARRVYPRIICITEKEEKEQAAAQRLRYTDWNKELQDRIAALRVEKKTWTSEAATMRAAEKEAKVREPHIPLRFRTLLCSQCLPFRTRSPLRASC